ncbi:MAG TPA: type VI secretion system tip protein TssI/VgrG [Chthoniobacterales bacterium]
MPTYTQAHRPLAVTTPLGKDLLLLTGLRGCEAVSQLFNFQLDLLAEAKSEVRFDRLLGQNVTVEMRLANGEKRYFNGLIKRFTQGARDEAFVHFRAELVPQFWLLTKKVRSRTFQHLSVPDILRQVLSGLDVAYEILGTYYPRDYCVQYRESDFSFVSRLLEEEGIYYFFKHGEASHQMVMTDAPIQHPTVPGQSTVIYEEVSGGARKELRITTWEKSQELRSGECTLRDHSFEIPGNHLETREKTMHTVAAGEVTHQLNVGGNDRLEIYDYPGGYAQRFDGVDRNGAARPQDLNGVFPDGERTVRVRMEEEAAVSLEIGGTSNCGHFVAGHQFTLERHFNANDRYLLTRVEHVACLEGNYRSNQATAFTYHNGFTCIPVALPYRPPRVTHKPVISGVQTATVTGPPGEELFCDKYGRVKVQFHWDREGKKDADSSCWVRVAQVWAGKGWGAFFWPRTGHEVVVAFEEGDPDQPLIVGSVYNAENMPPYELPAKKILTGLKSASHKGISSKNFNGIVFNDQKGHEHLALHSEHNLSLNSEYDKMIHAGRHRGERVAGTSVMTVGSIPMGGGSGGGNGSGMDAGNTIPSPSPINEAPGLNAVMVFGENMQACIGLNHQLAIGNNHQICINPFGLLAGIPGIPVPGVVTGLMGAGMGGNVQLTFGASAAVTVGQAFEINLGKDKISIDAGYKQHVVTVTLCGVLAAAAILYAIGYGLKNKKNQYLACGKFTIAYQAVVDAILAAILVAENVMKEAEDTRVFALNTLYGVKPNPEPDATAATPGGWVAGCAAGLELLGAILVPLVLAGEDSDVKQQEDSAAQSSSAAPAGGGSGGGADDGDDQHSVAGIYTVTASGVEIISRTPLPPAEPGKSVITLLATGETVAGVGPGGMVEVRGNSGVRITAGPPIGISPLTSPPVSDGSTNGVEIIVGQAQNVTIQRGVFPGSLNQKIELTPDGITIDAGMDGAVTIKAGVNSITIDAIQGITIQGLPFVKVN